MEADWHASITWESHAHIGDHWVATRGFADAAAIIATRENCRRFLRHSGSRLSASCAEAPKTALGMRFAALMREYVATRMSPHYRVEVR